MAALLIGYARCSTDQQDLTAQRDGVTALGVAPARMYVDQELTGTNRDRPGLREPLVACREGDHHLSQHTAHPRVTTSTDSTTKPGSTSEGAGCCESGEDGAAM